MLDFLVISTRRIKKNGEEYVEVYPNFRLYPKSSDLMVRGGDFYAVWDEEAGLWSTDEDTVKRLVDMEIKARVDELEGTYADVRGAYMWDSRAGSIDVWHKYCQKQMRDSFEQLDSILVFANDTVDKNKYSSKRLPYPLGPGPTPGYDTLMSTLYSPEERHKIEWAIGAIVTGDSKTIQKFLVFYGSAGTGKSTVLNIIEKLFEGYCGTFEAKALGSSNDSFALEAFANNPLVAIQHDGDLSRIEDNTRLNSLVSHELMMVNKKFEKKYPMRFNSFLLMGTNKPVKITEGKSGILRRLIDVSPTGVKLSRRDYNHAYKQVSFELGAIAHHCREVYLENPGYYDDYVPLSMMGASNDFYNYVADSYGVFSREDGTTLTAAWEMYKTYCDDAKVPYPMSKMRFKEELKNYFWDFTDRMVTEDGSRLRSYYSKFRTDIFESETENEFEKKPEGKNENNGPGSENTWIKLTESTSSAVDGYCHDKPAQYANADGTPVRKWTNCTTVLSQLDTTKLHYVKPNENHIVIDFDIKDRSGNKSLEKNLEAAKSWPPTYAELSKSGQGIHLHYIYDGDPTKLSRIYDDDIEIKVFTGNSSLRRKLTKCNDLPIAPISSGLPLKGDDKLINFEGVKNEKAIRTLIKRNLNKEYHAATKPSIDFINDILEKAYASGIPYDVSDMENAVIAFAAQSTNQSPYCLKLTETMKFKSEQPSDDIPFGDEAPIVFYDIEVFPNLFLVCWKFMGEGKPIVRMFNPKPAELEELLKFRLIGFNNLDYDNHMVYAGILGHNNEQLYNLSQKIIKSKKGDPFSGKFNEAYNLSFTDIYDFASAGNKMSLKKLEIEMGIFHDELGIPWDQPVPKEKWERVGDYCCNDVIATEAAFHYLKGDWIARQILSDITGMPENTRTNQLSARIIFGNNKNPQSEFNYRFLGDPVGPEKYEEYRRKFGDDYKFRVFDADGMPRYRDFRPGEKLPAGWSILPFFPGYKFEFGKSTYLGEEIGEGGRVYAEPGMYVDVWDADVTGQHPSSIIAEVLFGPKYTKAFKDIVDGRVSIKHQAWDDIDELFDGKLKPYIQRVIDGELSAKDLANALKTVVNAVYGQTKASYECAFRDKRNVDNIVAKRGALFMTLLKREVQSRGYTVAHIKTDSIKIPGADDKIRDFVLKFGAEYGYSFETEAEFDRFCLVNDAVYVAKTTDGEWTATGKQFAVPYVFKSLFSKEPITFDDMCETISVSKGALYFEDAEGETQFIGKVSRFTPIKPGCGGNTLYRINEGAKGSPSGTKGYYWLESGVVKAAGLEDSIDKNYYINLVDKAVAAISKYGDFEWFVSDDKEEPVYPYTTAENPEDNPYAA